MKVKNSDVSFHNKPNYFKALKTQYRHGSMMLFELCLKFDTISLTSWYKLHYWCGVLNCHVKIEIHTGRGVLPSPEMKIFNKKFQNQKKGIHSYRFTQKNKMAMISLDITTEVIIKYL